MKTIITTLNAKYIHQSLALRLLFVANRDRADISFEEFTIKKDLESIASTLLEKSPDIVAIGVYIWNVEKIAELIKLLKSDNPELIIILGGPEVSYEPEYFLDNWNVNYVISGEGEFVLGELLEAIANGSSTILPGVSSKIHINNEIAQADLIKLAELPSPYTLPEDKESIGNRLIYFETSRGCPYQCQYCLSSLEKGVRYFPKDYIFENLNYLIDNGAKQIKFLDRTFNLNKAHTQSIFDFLLAKYRPNLSCQFEVYADILTSETINFLNTNLPHNYFRFEIGIQSTHKPTNLAVKRRQDFRVLATNIEHLMAGGKIDLHLDLIAGLPYETFDLFVKSFNDVFAFKAKELQLGFLKMLRGTNLRKDSEKYGYSYDQNAPYQIISNRFISQSELERIHSAEHMLEKYWNSGKFYKSLNSIFNNQYNGKYFQFFDQLADYYKIIPAPSNGHKLEELFTNLNNFLLSKGIDAKDTLRYDYYSCFAIRPTTSFLPTITNQEKKLIINQIMSNIDFITTNSLDRITLKKNTIFERISDTEIMLIEYINSDSKTTIKQITYTMYNS